MTVAISTACTLVAFAANSILCRLALGGGLVDPLTFTTIRLVSGALALGLIARATGRENGSRKTGGRWLSGAALFVYAAAFSLAYASLGAGTGALLLFGAVQVTMIGAALGRGERLGPAEWVGGAVALAGLVYLVSPGIAAPNPAGALLMAAAGVAWGVYSIRGRGAPSPVTMTAGDFIRAAPMALVVSAAGAAWFPPARPTLRGAMLAVVSGAAASGLGYVLWYRALRSLTTARASLVQLLVPVLAAVGGVLFLGERVTARLFLAGALVLGGVACAVMRRRPSRRAVVAEEPNAREKGPCRRRAPRSDGSEGDTE